MKSNEIIRAMMNATNTSQKQLQEALGLKSLSSVTGFLKSDVRCETLQKIAEVMNCEVVVKNRDTGKTWIISDTEIPERSVKSDRWGCD